MTDKAADPEPTGAAPTPQRMLQATELFRGIPAEVLDVLASRFQEREVPAGTVVVRDGEPGGEMFLVASGRLQVSKRMQGRVLRLGTLGPGDAFGEMALLQRVPRMATVTAEEPTRLWVLADDSLEEAIRLVPQLGARLRELARQRAVANALKALQ